jgi:hypothetical protein
MALNAKVQSEHFFGVKKVSVGAALTVHPHRRDLASVKLLL